MIKHTPLILALSVLLSACDAGDSRSRTGSNAASAGVTPAIEQSKITSSCLLISVQGNTTKDGQRMPGYHNFSVSNNCQFEINARLYSGGFIGEKTSTLAPGEHAVHAFFITSGQPRGLACIAPLQPHVSLANGLVTDCL